MSLDDPHFTDRDTDGLRALVDAIIPADDYPSASAAGALDFLAGVVRERPEWGERILGVLGAAESRASNDFGASFGELTAEQAAAVLGALGAEPEFAWFAALVNAGYYADEANGGNRGEASWRMIDWRPGPAGGWSEELGRPHPSDRPDSPSVRTGDPAERYDAIVIGSGAGGGTVACVLAEAGRSVLVVEAGDWPATAYLAEDHLHNPRSTWDLETRSGPADSGHPRVVERGGRVELLRPGQNPWGNNAFTVGGGTRVYGAQAWRLTPEDFRMASTYGVPDGSALADWPFGYDELEPYYDRAEWEVGVSGDVPGAFAGPRARPYPMGPLPGGRDRELLAAGARSLGLGTLAVPLLVNSTRYLGRGGCEQCSMCVGFACPVDAKNGSQNTVLTRALASGNCTVLTGTTAERIVTDGAGRVTGVALVGGDGSWRRTVSAADVIVAAGAAESARLLLNSASDREPNGLGNNADQVGRHLQAHLYGGAIGVFEEDAQDLLGPGVSIGSADYRHGNPGVIGGGILANEFVTTPSNTYDYLASAGLIPAWGAGSKAGMVRLAKRLVRVQGPIHEVTMADSRVRIDPSVTDRYGIPVARLSGGLHPEDVRARDFLARRAAEWLDASGATNVRISSRSIPVGPSSGQHQAGTCRMGTDPATSVVDPLGRVWGHDNLRVADGSVHVTNGGVNPVLTIFANAFRIGEKMLAG